MSYVIHKRRLRIPKVAVPHSRQEKTLLMDLFSLYDHPELEYKRRDGHTTRWKRPALNSAPHSAAA